MVWQPRYVGMNFKVVGMMSILHERVPVIMAIRLPSARQGWAQPTPNTALFDIVDER